MRQTNLGEIYQYICNSHKLIDKSHCRLHYSLIRGGGINTWSVKLTRLSGEYVAGYSLYLCNDGNVGRECNSLKFESMVRHYKWRCEQPPSKIYYCEYNFFCWENLQLCEVLASWNKHNKNAIVTYSLKYSQITSNIYSYNTISRVMWNFQHLLFFY